MQSQVYSLDNLNHFAEVLNDIDTLAQMQGLPADGAVAEASPGQFEVNLNHTDNVLLACDHALSLKRLVRLVAENHHLHATFMAKPYEEYAGSGMHVHISMLDGDGKNLFTDADGEDSPLLHRALAGMITLMPASMALLAPNINAFRRFQPGMYVPTRLPGGIITAQSRCAFPAAIRRITGWNTASPGPTPTPIWWWRRSWLGSCMAWTTNCRCLSR